MKVSIIVPIYNVEKYVGECIESLINQTYRDIEIILVDDGSPDGSGAICDEYAARDGRIKVIHKENGGPSLARLAGITASLGDAIMTVDGDDWLDPETVSECVARMKDGVDLVMFSYVKEYPNASIDAHVLEGDIDLSKEAAEDAVYRRLFGIVGEELKHPERMASVGSCCMKLYRREVALRGKDVHVGDIGSSEDTVFNMYALHGVRGVVYIDKCFYHYRKLDTSITNSYRPHLVDQWEVLYGIIEGIVEEKGLSSKYKEAFSNFVAINVIGLGANEFSNKERGFFYKKKRIRKILKNERMDRALRALDCSAMPRKWRVFMFFAKHKCSFMLSLMYVAIRILKKRKA